MATTVTLESNRVVSGAAGYDFVTDHETVSILTNIVIASDNHDGVDSIYSDSVLINRGYIFSVQGTGVSFSLATVDSRITNAFGALIVGTNGVELDGTGSQIFNNNGKVIGSDFDGFQASEAATINNHGLISGLQSGVDFRNIISHSTSVLNNYGIIQSDNKGVRMDTFSNDVNIIINNYASGIIKGSLYSIDSDSSMFTLTNLGRIIGTIIDEVNLHDTVTNHGLIKGVLKLQGGNDVFNGNGGTSGAVFGGDGNDHLAGGAHADLLHGGANNDTLTGRLGADRFFFDTALNPVTNVDTITDFTPAQLDKVVLSESIFPNVGALGPLGAAHFHIGAHAVTLSQRIIYNPNSGFLFYDQDGSATIHPQIHFATVALHLPLHSADFLVVA